MSDVHAAPKPEPRAPKPPKALRKKSPHRDEDMVELFGEVARREWIASMACSICGVTGWTENAHAKPRSRGGKAQHIVPLCGPRIALGVEGCHRPFDRYELEEHRARLLRLARELDRQWNERGVR